MGKHFKIFASLVLRVCLFSVDILTCTHECSHRLPFVFTLAPAQRSVPGRLRRAEASVSPADGNCNLVLSHGCTPGIPREETAVRNEQGAVVLPLESHF